MRPLIMLTMALASLVTPATAESPRAAAPPGSGAGNEQICPFIRVATPRRWQDGRTVLYADRNIRLVATARNGKLLGVRPVNLTGRPIRTRVERTTARGSRPCIFCYNLDSPLGSCCIEVPCWLIPILKPFANI